MTCRNIWAVAVLLACAMSIPAQAELITFTFGGTVTEVEDGNDFLGGTVSIGDGFSGSYTFESTTPDHWPGDPTIGSYRELLVAMTGFVADVPFQKNTGYSGTIVVLDGFSSSPYSSPVDEYLVDASVAFANTSWSFLIDLDDLNATALDSDVLCTRSLPIDSFDTSAFRLYAEAENVAIRGAITSLLPEPDSLLVLLLGAGVVLGMRR